MTKIQIILEVEILNENSDDILMAVHDDIGDALMDSMCNLLSDHGYTYSPDTISNAVRPVTIKDWNDDRSHLSQHLNPSGRW